MPGIIYQQVGVVSRKPLQLIKSIDYFIISGIFWLMQRVAGDPPEGEQEFGLGGQEFLEQFVEQSEPSEPSIWLQILAGIAVALLVGAILLVLARAFRRNTRWLRVEEEGEREEPLATVVPGN